MVRLNTPVHAKTPFDNLQYHRLYDQKKKKKKKKKKNRNKNNNNNNRMSNILEWFSLGSNQCSESA